jgi:glutamyl-tRNA reductase
VANRTYEKAKKLADELDGTAIKYEEMGGYIKLSDVVISATAAPHLVVTRDMIENAMSERNKDILLVDIANPRDIEEATCQVQGVRLFNIDSLKSISEKNLTRRKSEVPKY